MVMMAGTELPEKAIKEQIAGAVQIIVQLNRLSDGSRKIVEIAEVSGIKNDIIEIHTLFVFQQTGFVDGKVNGSFTSTGMKPQFFNEINIHGLELDEAIFSKQESICY
jgi:pilus assembly protein CpaF